MYDESKVSLVTSQVPKQAYDMSEKKGCQYLVVNVDLKRCGQIAILKTVIEWHSIMGQKNSTVSFELLLTKNPFGYARQVKAARPTQVAVLISP